MAHWLPPPWRQRGGGAQPGRSPRERHSDLRGRTLIGMAGFMVLSILAATLLRRGVRGI